MNRLHMEILGIDENADRETIKKAYRSLVRRHHPDLFSPEERPVQEWKMIQINEAYAGLLADLKLAKSVPPNTTEARDSPTGRVPGWDYELHGCDPVLSSSRAIGASRDPAYVYYKQGFVHFSRGLGGIMDGNHRDKLTPDAGGMNRAAFALKSFRIAHGYFRRVLDEFPQSIWAHDAGVKIRRIESFNAIYLKIKKNLAGRLTRQSMSRETQSPEVECG